MNVLAALLVLALAHDPRAFKMPKKAKAKPEALPVAGSQLPAKPSEPAPVTEPAPPAQPVQAEPEPAPEPESKSPKPIMFEMPKAEPKAEAAPAATNRQPATQAAPAPKPTRKKKPIPPRMFELPKKNVSN